MAEPQMTESLTDRILERLEAKGPVSKPNAKGYVKAICPFHDEKEPSFFFHHEQGNFTCFGCGAKGTTRSLAEKLGLQISALTLEDLAEYTRLPIDWLEKVTRKGKKGVEIPYSDENGQEVAVRSRLNLTDSGVEGRFKWRKGDHILPYGLWQIDIQKEAWKFTILVEGESDCWTLWHNRFPAIGIPGANNWKPEWVRYFKGFDRIYLWVEPDKGGRNFVRSLSADIPDLLVLTPPLGIKDPLELFKEVCDGVSGQDS